jgi:PAS domain S-box-containing protein
MTGQRRSSPTFGAISVDLRADQLVTTLDLIADGLTLVNGDGLMVFVNRPLCAMFGYEPLDLLGQSVEMLVPDDRRPDHQRDRRSFTQQGTARTMGRPDLDIEGRHRTGRRFSIDVQLAPLTDTDLLAATVRDVSDIRRAAVDRALNRLDLRAAQSRVASLIAAHDLALQRLFALGTHFEAQASRPSTDMAERFSEAVVTVDEVIDSIREAALESGDQPPDQPSTPAAGVGSEIDGRRS